jgi:phage shock protein PspC (stress-responsive transcriptional regulator)
MNKKLFRKPVGALLGGVSAGIAEYLGIDPLFIRLFIVLWAVTGGSAFLVYLVLWVVMPAEGDTSTMNLDGRIKQVGIEISEVARHPNSQLVVFAGVGLIGMGVFFILQQAGFPWSTWFNWKVIWPVVLVLAGIALLVRSLIRKN